MRSPAPTVAPCPAPTRRTRRSGSRSSGTTPRRCASPTPPSPSSSDGETIILDSGTTTAEIARGLRRLPLTSINVITNALNIAALLLQVPNVRLIVPGGILRRESNSLSGPMAEAALDNLQADRVYLGADAIDPEIGVMTPHLAEAELNAKMIRISRQVVVVADSSKLQRRNISLIAKVQQLHMLITDRGAPAQAVEDLRSRGVEVRLV